VKEIGDQNVEGNWMTPRERLQRAIVAAVADGGSQAATIAEAMLRTGMSAREFHAEFADGEECLLTASDAIWETLLERTGESYNSRETWPARLRAALTSLTETIAANESLAKVMLIEIPAAGPTAHRHYRDGVDRLLRFLVPGREYSERGEELPQRVELLALGGAETIVFDEVAAGRAEDLPALVPDILFAILVLYLGPEWAAEEAGLATGVS
jgi:hypothetical protein